MPSPVPSRSIVAVATLAAGCLAFAATHARAQPSPPDADLVRLWAIPPERRPADAGARLAEAAAHPDAGPWEAYFAAGADPSGEARGAALERLLDEGPPDGSSLPEPLRLVAIEDMRSDLAWRSDRALFVRRYGFYARWFNRVSYVASRAVQGNFQAASQLLVDGLFDWIGRGRATPAERKAYRLLNELDRAGRAERSDAEKIERLGREVERTLAEVDLERANWAARAGRWDLAEIYARWALGRRPDWAAAKAALAEAEREAARANRTAVASRQVGFADRPASDAAPADAVRSAMAAHTRAAWAPSAAPNPAAPADAAAFSPVDRALLTIASGRTAGAGRMGAVRDMQRALASLPPGERPAWIESALASPGFNPELRLARARGDLAASRAEFVLLGPESARDQAYKVSSRVAQFWSALTGVGIFYGFEIAYRGVVSAFRPPPPADEALDAAAAYWKAAPGESERRDEIARWLVKRKIAAGEFDAARRGLEAYGVVDPELARGLDAGEVRRLVEEARALPSGSEARKAKLEEARRVAPDERSARSAEREAERRVRDEKLTVRVSWKSLAEWTGEPAPSGAPGANPDWFDGDPLDGEIDGDSFELVAEGTDPARVEAVYPIRRGDRTLRATRAADVADLTPKFAEWMRDALERESVLRREARRLDREGIPYELQGGAGLSGVDFYPRLLPLDLDPRETELFD